MKSQLIFSCIIIMMIFSQALRGQSNNEVRLILEVTEVPGTQDEVIGSLIVEQFEDMAAYQFSLQWDPEELEYLELEYFNNEIGITQQNFNYNLTGEGFLPTVWSGMGGLCASLNHDDVIMSIRFRRHVTTSEFIISPDPIGLRFYECDGTMIDLYYTDNQGTLRIYNDNTTNTVTHTTSGHFSVSPNPTTGRINIQHLTRNPNDQYQYTLLSLLGNRLADGEVNGSSIDLPAHLPSGQYFIRIGHEGMVLGTKRIVLIK